MKTINILLLCGALTVFANAQEKRYELKSAKILYSINGSGKMMGMNTKLSGEASLLFTDYGKKELSSETTTQDIMGQKEITKSMTKIENDTIYSVDFEEQTINTMSLKQFAQYSPQKGEQTLKEMGAKKVGYDTVLGYKCENWEFQGTKTCFYKGVLLKSTSSMMGVTQTQIATKIDFDPKITKNSFDLPKFKAQEMTQDEEMPSNEEMNKMLESIKNMYGN